MLGLLGGAAGVLGMGRCSGGGSTVAAVATARASATAAPSASPSSSATASTGATACTTTPEGEIGPYFTDDSASGYDRSDIRSNIDGSSPQTGVPLALTIYVFDTEKSCAAYAGAQIDIWHCNASGIYSNESVENSLGSTWLRGYQLTDATGKATFTTIVPGWYAGRTTHIHVRIRSTYNSASSTSDGSNTTQLFFAQPVVDYLAQSVAPYDAEGSNATTNANDHVYAGETKGANLLSLVGDASTGYTATISLGIPIGA